MAISAEPFLNMSEEEQRALIVELAGDPDRIRQLIHELNSRPQEERDRLGHVLNDNRNTDLNIFLNLKFDIDLVIGLELGFEFDLNRELGRARALLKILVLAAYAKSLEPPALSRLEVMVREAEAVHAQATALLEHADLLPLLEEAIRQLEVADELTRDLARSNAAALRMVTGTIPALIESAKGTVAAGEPDVLVERSRRQFLGLATTIGATLLVGGAQIYSSTEDADRIVAAIEAGRDERDAIIEHQQNTIEQQQATIEQLAQALHEALAALHAACTPPAA